jgi:elongation factor P
VEQRKAQFLYRDDNLFIFMDSQSFDQYVMSSDQLDDSITYLKDGLDVELRLHDGNAIGIEIPISVAFEVVESDPGFRGNTAASTTKPAILETGLKINVPLFVNVGDVVLVDTRKGAYMERVT